MQISSEKHRRSRIAKMQAEVARVIDRHTQGMADCATPIPALTLFRREAPARPVVCMIEPSIVMVAQGAKRLLVGGEGYAYDAERFLTTSVDLPANSEVIEASTGKPCVGLGLRLDIRLLAELIAQDGDALSSPRSPRSPRTSVGVGSITEALLDPFVRLLALLDEPAAIAVLAPLIQREIHYRLLATDQAARLRQIVAVGSQNHRVARAIDWLKLHYAEPLRIDELAVRVQMSPSSLHHHFKQLTAMSPLQYQKWLRLNEARRLMLSDGTDAATAAFNVGYESPSQFSREYARFFGAPPRRDVEALRPSVGGLASRGAAAARRQHPTSTARAAGSRAT
ncbi:AraC family transcriptional regulator [Piscinibacter defluvii]|uniref:AraC family transcriptional regulator n=1 Tax=Piscinibacter defluvii TaxID=1796922 RepID=UPI000FDDDAE3|nr:AraC family transcriptional regulator [Piscinibacter defluvii]